MKYKIKGSFGGQLLTAVGVDSNDNIFPISYAIVENENKDSWVWFLELLKKDLGISDEDEEKVYTFVSDKQKGLIPAFEMVLPSVAHRFCVRHLHANMKMAGFTGTVLRDALWAAARETTKNSFVVALNKLKEIDVKAYDWLLDKHPSEWSRAYFNTTAKSDMLVNNISESFNSMILEARESALINCLELLRKKIMFRMYECRKRGAKWVGPICPNIMKKVEEIEKGAGGYIGYPCDDDLFEMTGMYGDQHTVDLEAKTCSCRRWELTGIPCVHAISAIWHKHDKILVWDYVDPFYSTKSYMDIYAGSIKPMPGPEEWPLTDREPPLPPLYSARVGRPTKLRKKGAGEQMKKGAAEKIKKGAGQLSKDGVRLSRKFVKLHCTKCKQPGHNARSCKQGVQAGPSSTVQQVENQAPSDGAMATEINLNSQPEIFNETPVSQPTIQVQQTEVRDHSRALKVCTGGRKKSLGLPKKVGVCTSSKKTLKLVKPKKYLLV